MESSMQVRSSNSSLASQIQALEKAAFAEYQPNQDFSLLLQTGGSGSSATTSSGSSSPTSNSNNNWQMSGSVTGTEVYAVGTGFGDSFKPFSQEQIQSEQDAIETQRMAAYSDTLQNFLILSQASGQLAGTTMSDHMTFSGDNGLIGGSVDTNLSLSMVSGGARSA
jgi:hypothetical protein